MKIFKMSPSRGRSDTYFGSYERVKKSYDRVFDACVASWAMSSYYGRRRNDDDDYHPLKQHFSEIGLRENVCYSTFRKHF